MLVRAAEKRLSMRVSAAYPVTVLDEDRNVLTSGRTANISENGLLAVVKGGRFPAEVLLTITLPSGSSRSRSTARKVTYRARVVRQQVLGNLVGLGVQLLEKAE